MNKFIYTKDLNEAIFLRKYFTQISDLNGTYVFINDVSSAFYTEGHFNNKKLNTTNLLIF